MPPEKNKKTQHTTQTTTTLLDCLTCGIPWPESRKTVYRLAPDDCRADAAATGRHGESGFYSLEPLSNAEKGSTGDLPSISDVFEDIDAYISSPRTGVRRESSKLRWHAAIVSDGKTMNFRWADLRELKIKIIFNRQFWSPYHGRELDTDQVGEIFRYYNRVLHTLRRIKTIRWIKITASKGRLRIHILRDDVQNATPFLLLERSFYRGVESEHFDELQEQFKDSVPEHVLGRLSFWQMEETGTLTGLALDEAVRSEDEVLATWAVANLRQAADPFVKDRIRKVVAGDNIDDTKSAVRTAGRLWLVELESDVMRQFYRWENSIGPAVADYIGAIGLMGRAFLPKILQTLTRKGDFATLVSTFHAMGSFPGSTEAKAIPQALDLMLGLPENISAVVDRFPGVHGDMYTSWEAQSLLSPMSLEVLRSTAIHALIETAARTSPDDIFSSIVPKFHIDSPFIEKLLEEIETNIRTHATWLLLDLLKNTAEPGDKYPVSVPVTRRVVLIARTILRINKPGERAQCLFDALPLMAAHVGAYRRDTELRFGFFIDNYPHESYIALNSILKGLPDRNAISEALLARENLTDKEKYLVMKICAED